MTIPNKQRSIREALEKMPKIAPAYVVDAYERKLEQEKRERILKGKSGKYKG